MESGDWVMNLPAAIASLNATSALLLLVGGWAIKKGGNEALHKACMILAFLVSTVFLVLYLIYHAQVGHVVFEGEGLIKVIYFALLIPHILLAAVQVPLIILTIKSAIKGQRERHVKLARWTYPIWMYVSVSGVVIYYMVFHIDPT